MLDTPGPKSSRQSSTIIVGTEAEENQPLSDGQLELVDKYRFFAYSLTKGYHGGEKTREELRAGAEGGLIDAARRFDPSLGFPFAAYARKWIKGGILGVFKSRKIHKCTTLFGALERIGDDGELIEFDPIDERDALPPIDLGILKGKQRQVIEARLAGKTLEEIGADLGGISAERARQIESEARTKLRKGDELPFRVAPGDREARRFGSEWKECRGDARALANRRGYRRPHRDTYWLENSRFEQIKYAGRSLAPEEIAAVAIDAPAKVKPYKPINSHGNPFCLFPQTSRPTPHAAIPEINRGNGFVSMRRNSEYNPKSHDPIADYARIVAENYRHLPPHRPSHHHLSRKEKQLSMAAVYASSMDAIVRSVRRFPNAKMADSIEAHREAEKLTAAIVQNRQPHHHCQVSGQWPQASRAIVRHRANAPRLAEFRGNVPLRRAKGPCGGPVIHGGR